MFLVSSSRLFARHVLTLCAGLIATVAALVAQTPSAMDGFDPDIDGNVYAVVAQPDGKLLVGGQFTTVRGTARKNLARLNPDGSLDESFNPTANAPVRAIALQSDNRILIGGDFTSLQPGATGDVINRGRIARLNANGTVDTAFNPNLSGALQPGVYALLVQPDGRIVVGGSFTSAQPNGQGAATTRNHLARFNSDGSLDASFDPNPNAMVLALAYHVDNKIVVGGGFNALHPAGDSAPTTRNRIARLNPSGTVDSEFNPNANNGVTALAVQRDGKILLGGYFTTVQPIGDENPANRVHIARLNVDGTLDSEFYPRVDGNVFALAVQPDGAILVGGNFPSLWGRGTVASTQGFIARLTTDGSLDNVFTPTVNASVDALAIQPDGKIVIGGHFTRAIPDGAVTPLVRNHIARLNPNGTFDSNFELDAGGRILASVTQSDGKVVVAGTFTNVGGATHNYVARLNSDGSVDSTYNPNFNGRVYALAYEASSGKVIAGGAFTTIGGESRNFIARLNPSGTIDSEFNPNLNGQVGAIVLQNDGRILVGGTFTSAHPIGSADRVARSNILRLNSNGTLDTGFDPATNSSVSAIAVQPDGKILLGGLFSAISPGSSTNTSATITGRNFIARVNADGTLDTAFNPNFNGQISTIVVQSDNKIVVGGVFTALAPEGATEATTRNHIARLNADGTIDTAYDPNVGGNVLTAALQSDGKLLIGGAFISIQPNGRSDWILRKYAARLNTDGTVDESYNLDISERPGNRVDSLRIAGDRVYIGGSFASLHPAGTAARISRRGFARLAANGEVDASFDPSIGGSTGAVIHAFAVQPDGKVIAVGDFADLGGAKSTNLARYLPEGTPDPAFNSTLTTSGPVHAIAIRPNAAPVPSQLAGFAWLNANGTLRPGFTSNARLSGQVEAVAVQDDGRLILGGAFANVANTTGGNLVRFNANGEIDTSFNPAPNGSVSAIAIQSDGKIVIGGSFSIVHGVARNRIARLNPDGSLDSTFDPNASGQVDSIIIQGDGLIVIAGSFTTLTPNGATTAVNRNYIARLNTDGTVDTTYNPTPNFNVSALAIQGDGKVVIGGTFTSLQPNSGTEAFTRNGIARLNTDGTLDQNFNPNANGPINTIVALANGQLIIGGSFFSLQPGATGTVYTRNNIARVHSDGSVDTEFNPNANGAVNTLSVQPDGSILLGGTFTTLQPGDSSVPIARHGLARIDASGALDFDFNPDVNGSVLTVIARPDGTAFVGGSFTGLQLNGSIVIGGTFANVGGVPAVNLATLNDDGSVNSTFQPRPDGAVHAVLVLPDGRMVIGGAFTNIAGAARNRLARFNADGTLDAAFNPNVSGPVHALALAHDGRILVGGAFATIGGQSRTNLARLNTDGGVDASFNAALPANSAGVPVSSIAVQPDGRILFVAAADATQTRTTLFRVNTDGAPDASFAAALPASGSARGIALQADGRVITAVATSAAAMELVRLNADGSRDASFAPAVNGAITSVALQPDGRVMIGGSFTSVGGQPRVGLARLGATGPASQILGVTANRTTVIWNRAGTTGELSSATFEQSSDRANWTILGNGVRLAGTSDWQLTGLNLPASGVFYIRARGIAPSDAGTSSGIFETVREFNFANPVVAAPSVIAQTPAQAAAPAIPIDTVTGIAPRARLTMVPGEGTVEILATYGQANEGAVKPHLVNLSTRARVTTDNPLLLGFAISGTESRRVLIRGVGPGLTAFGVTDAVSATRIEIYDSTSKLIASNEGWADAANLVDVAAATGAFPFITGSADSATVLTLSPGTYTVQVLDPRASGGVALAEIYDAGQGNGSRLVNVSSRGAAGTGSAALISGFVIAGGDAPERVLLRGIGPGLAQFSSITNPVADPVVSLYDAEGRPLGANDNWVSSIADVSLATTSSGAFKLDVGSKDAAVLATLPSGAYTIQVSAGSTGTALLEIYEVR